MGLCGPIGDRQERAVGRIRRCQEHLLGLIDQLLDFKTIAAGRGAHRRPTEADRAAPRARYRPALALRADPARLRQVFVTLLANAAKFTPPRGTVCLGCDVVGSDV